MQVEIASRYAGPPGMGHGGYVAGLLAEQVPGPVQVTLRRPIPLDEPLELALVGGGAELRRGDEVLVAAEPTSFELDVPPAPSLAEAEEAQAGSPSFQGERGVHPICFGCGAAREDGLRIFAGPVAGGAVEQVAAAWRPGPAFADADGTVPLRYVVGALDCPGAFAFLAQGVGAGLLGRIAVEQVAPVRADEALVVSAWQIALEGRKMFAGTALTGPGGDARAWTRQTWFGFPGG